MPTLGYNLNMYVIPIRQINNLGRSVQISETEVRNETGRKPTYVV